MKLKINTAKIETLNPCDHRFNNWKAHYADFDGDALDFLDLPNITHSDKLWVMLRLLPRELVEVFAIDCAFGAYAYSETAYAVDAAYAAAYAAAEVAGAASNAAYAASYAVEAATYAAADAYAAYAIDNGFAERASQIKVLKYLIRSTAD